MSEEKNDIYLYKRSGSHFYYFRYVTSGGEVIRESTKKESEEEALEEARKRIIEIDKTNKNMSFRDLLEQFTDPVKNPKIEYAQKFGQKFSKRSSDVMARAVRNLIAFMDKKTPALLKKNVRELEKTDIVLIRNSLMESFDNHYTVFNLYRFLSPIFSYCVSNGIVNTNPVEGVTTPRRDYKEKVAIPAKAIAIVMSRKDLFDEPMFWAFFVVAATTGMRMAEIVALNKEQVDGKILKIDRAVKDSDGTIGLPKGDIVRTIVLPKIAMEALSTLTPDKDGRYFTWKYNKWSNKRWEVKIIAKACSPKEYVPYWEEYKGWHNLRHSLNSNLLMDPNTNPILVAEYMSWEHQIQNPQMQQHYTHVFVENLQAIADKIDELYKF